MYDIIELNGKKVAELREIATTLEISRVDKLKKQEGTRSLSGKSLAELTEDEKARLRALHRPPG